MVDISKTKVANEPSAGWTHIVRHPLSDEALCGYDCSYEPGISKSSIALHTFNKWRELPGFDISEYCPDCLTHLDNVDPIDPKGVDPRRGLGGFDPAAGKPDLASVYRFKKSDKKD